MRIEYKIYVFLSSVCDWLKRDKEYCRKNGKNFKSIYKSNMSLMEHCIETGRS